MAPRYAASLIAKLKTGNPSAGDEAIASIGRRLVGDGHEAIQVSSIGEIRTALEYLNARQPAELTSASSGRASSATGPRTSGDERPSEADAPLNERDGDRPAIVQLIGHGSAGVLYFDRPPPPESEGPRKRFYLSNDSDLYGVLKNLIKTPTEVFLLGCNVGMDIKRESVVSDGPTLLFALTQMWETHVWASREHVSADDFDPKTGLFKGTLVNYRGIIRRQFLQAVRNRTRGRSVKDALKDALKESLQEKQQKIENFWAGASD